MTSLQSQTWSDDINSNIGDADRSNFTLENSQDQEAQILFMKGEKVPEFTEVYYEGILSD
jgi:hypothetical protein